MIGDPGFGRSACESTENGERDAYRDESPHAPNATVRQRRPCRRFLLKRGPPALVEAELEARSKR